MSTPNFMTILPAVLELKLMDRLAGMKINHPCARIFRERSAKNDRLCGLVVRVLGYRSGGPGSIPGTTIKK
jgi:hypothetical protein